MENPPLGGFFLLVQSISKFHTKLETNHGRCFREDPKRARRNRHESRRAHATRAPRPDLRGWQTIGRGVAHNAAGRRSATHAGHTGRGRLYRVPRPDGRGAGQFGTAGAPAIDYRLWRPAGRRRPDPPAKGPQFHGQHVERLRRYPGYQFATRSHRANEQSRRAARTLRRLVPRHRDVARWQARGGILARQAAQRHLEKAYTKKGSLDCPREAYQPSAVSAAFGLRGRAVRLALAGLASSMSASKY